MKNKKGKALAKDTGIKGELVAQKDSNDIKPTGRNVKRNPFKTPPNNLTTKNN